ncbi:MAG: hypothetical protein HC860_21470 [Alkalinema sp. RU_4_3]|nr:hypothetical protein [Alkalinema sp. RU_4_3]
MHAEIAEALSAVETDKTVRTLLITGAGRGFCAGQDLSDRAVAPGGEAPDLGESVELLAAAILGAPAPGVAQGLDAEACQKLRAERDVLTRDGVKDNNEPGLQGWTIRLDRGANGSVDDTAVTDANGNRIVRAGGIDTEEQQRSQDQTDRLRTGPAQVTAAEGSPGQLLTVQPQDVAQGRVEIDRPVTAVTPEVAQPAMPEVTQQLNTEQPKKKVQRKKRKPVTAQLW